MTNPVLFSIFIVLILSLIYEYSFEDCYKKKHSKYLKACHSGLIRGVITGCVLGNFGVISAVHQGAVFGVLNPIMMHMGY